MAKLDITTLRLDRPGVRAVLGDLEAEVMEVVWGRASGEGVTVRDVWDELYPKRAVMYTTVMNTMTRLARKGLLAAERDERAFVYRAALDREVFVDRFVAGALERLLSNFAGTTRAHLRRLDDPDVRARVERLTEEIERQRTEGAG